MPHAQSYTISLGEYKDGLLSLSLIGLLRHTTSQALIFTVASNDAREMRK